MSDTIKLPGKWSLRKQVLLDESVWALQYGGMDWIKISEFLPARPSDPPSARDWLDNEIREFAAAMNGEKSDG
jgi:hypothetical protein